MELRVCVRKLVKLFILPPSTVFTNQNLLFFFSFQVSEKFNNIFNLNRDLGLVCTIDGQFLMKIIWLLYYINYILHFIRIKYYKYHIILYTFNYIMLNITFVFLQKFHK